MNRTAYQMVDCDVHSYFLNGLHDLAPYMTEAWQHKLGLGGGVPDWAKAINGGEFSLPGNSFYRLTSSPVRMDTVPPSGNVPGSDPNFVATQLLDEYGIDRALLIGGPNSDLGILPNVDTTAVIAAAYNDWICEKWLSVDERFRAAMLIGPNKADLAVKEIERVADRPGIAAIHMPSSRIAPGDDHFSPIYAAAEHYGLAIVAHVGGGGTYTNGPQSPFLTTYYVEGHATATQVAQSSVASLICHGVFERFPRLKYVFVESGFAWLPDLMWRLERNWKAHRAEIPWVTKRPLDYVVNNIRFTSQPMYEADKPEQLHAILDMMCAERTMLFASDYPHWDFDDPRRALKDVPENVRARMFRDNATETFGDRLD